MNPNVLLACPACVLSSPIVMIVSMVGGTVVVAFLLLRPFTRTIKSWGVPKLNVSRVVSLLIMHLCLVPIGFLGRQQNSLFQVSIVLAGLSACCVYLWIRACWLLDQYEVRSTIKALLFPGVLTPAILVLGTTCGNWIMGVILVGPAWPEYLVPLTIFSALVAVPLGFLVILALLFVFPDDPYSKTKRESLSEADRSRERFIDQIRNTQQLWVLALNGGLGNWTINDELVIPVWGTETEASACAVESLSTYEPQAFPVDEFLAHWLPTSIDRDALFAIQPSPNMVGHRIPAEDFEPMVRGS